MEGCYVYDKLLFMSFELIIKMCIVSVKKVLKEW